METYRRAVQERGQHKIRTLGSIVNTTTSEDLHENPKKVA
jgi:hypothetical protein